MGKNNRWMAQVMGSCVCLMAVTATGYSQGFYFNADAGVAVAEKVDLHNFFGSTPGVRVDLDPGIRFGAAGGYNFNPFIGIELESGAIHNSVEGVLNSSGGSGDATFSHIPLLANLVLRYDQPHCPVIPYIGGGAGGDISVVGLDDVNFNGVFADGTDSTIGFAWQAFGGLRYRLNETMSLGASYKFYSAEGASWDFAGFKNGIETGRAKVHNFMVEFNLKF
jgi:opacity protein-like surface antigen